MKKTQPLVNIGTQQAVKEIEFDSLWQEGQLSGWAEPKDGKGKGAAEGENASEGIWCSACKYQCPELFRG